MQRTFVSALLLITIGSPLAAEEPANPKYVAAMQSLRAFIQSEVTAKNVPALAIALVDDQSVVWADGFGHVDDKKTLAGPRTVFRIGSVSKPITSLLLMLFVEKGLIDLDAPVTDYLPDFEPTNKSGKKITLRQIVCHRSGLVREPPVGGYFDATYPSLTDTVKSLNKTELVYDPETTTSYSNAAPCIAGLVIERVAKKPFAKVMEEELFVPLGMSESGVLLTPGLRAKLPRAVMGTYYDREFPAPVFDLATTPAGNIASTALDQAKLLSFLFSGGEGPKGRVMKRDTLDKMWTVQFAKEGTKSGFGLGFHVSEFDAQRRVGHNGAVYGFATEFAALPDRKLGVVVLASRDVANGLVRRIGDVALRSILAVKEGKPLPPIERTAPIDPETGKSVAGRYRSGEATVELIASNGRLWFWPPNREMRFELRQRGKSLVIDDHLSFGATVVNDKGDITWNKQTFIREATPEPRPIPKRWEGLIGEYGPDHNHLIILEKDGVLCALIEWVFLYPLNEISDTEFKFPNYGLYHGHPLKFQRDATGRATVVEAANYRFDRRGLPKAGENFQLTPIRPLDELRKLALAANPPRENNALMRQPDLVDLTTLDKTIKLDIRYASANNFLGAPFYTSSRAFLQRPAAEAVVRANKTLEPLGYALLIHDAYRPWHVTKMFFDAVPPRFHGFVADPQLGSRHNRGCAVDLTLYDLKTGAPIDMVSVYDEFSDRSYPNYLGGTSQQRAHRDLLRSTMESEGFTVFDNEWWHFDYRDWRSYPILNQTFEKLR